MVNTPEYALAKFLDNMIRPYLPLTHMLKSIDHFIKELKEFNPNNQNTMVSFGVVSLFTNVPLVDTIDTTLIDYIMSSTIILFRFPKLS